MAIEQLFLILLSGLGVLHGFLLSIFLWLYKKGNVIANRFLACLLLVLSFRVGKSVILEFAGDPNFKLIFTGLGALLLIGPLFYFYTLSVLSSEFRPGRKHALHFIPAAAAIALGLGANREIITATPQWIFIVLFTIYYAHYIFYSFLSWKRMQRSASIKEQQEAISWLKTILFGLMMIWVVYVLNLLEDSVPYILGPVLYSLVVYPISFIAIKKGYVEKLAVKKYTTTASTDAEVSDIYERVKKVLLDNKKYKDPRLSLPMLSDMVKATPQKVSMAINVRSGSNFNDLVNDYRLEEALLLMRDKQYKNHTIAAIAYECGFNTLSTFNAAFKKKLGKTPSAYRKSLS